MGGGAGARGDGPVSTDTATDPLADVMSNPRPARELHKNPTNLKRYVLKKGIGIEEGERIKVSLSLLKQTLATPTGRGVRPRPQTQRLARPRVTDPDVWC